MSLRILAAVAVVASLASFQAAHAEPGLANKVYEPYVKKGVTEVELRAGRLNGGSLDGESGAVVELEHGFSDRLSLAVLGEFEHHAGEKSKLDAVAIEGVAYLGQIPGVNIDVAAYAEYEQRIHNESGVLEGKVLLAKQSGPVQTLVNFIVERPLTNKSDQRETEFGYAVETTVAATSSFRLGVQAFGDLGTSDSFGGRRAHYLGPVAKWELRPAWLGRGELELEAAYLAPLGTARNATHSQVRVALEFERRF